MNGKFIPCKNLTFKYLEIKCRVKRCLTIPKTRLQDIVLGYKGQPILFVHGFSVSPHNHYSYLNKLSKTNKVYAPDYTRQVKPSSFNEHVNLISEYADDKNLKDYIIIGYSLGAGIALDLANNTSPRELYTSLNSQVPSKVICLAPLLPVDYNHIGFFTRAVKLLFNEVKDTIQNPDTLPKKLNALDDIIRTKVTAPKEQYNTVKDLAKYSYDGYDIKQPVQMIIGNKDEFFGEIDVKNLAQGKIHNLEHITIPYAGHDLMKYDDLILSYNRRFLQNG